MKLYLVCLVVPIGFDLGPLYMTNVRLVLIAAILPAFVRLFLDRGIKLHLADAAFLAFVAWMTLSLAINDPARVVQASGSTSVEFLGGYLLGRVYVRERAQFVRLCIWVAGLAALTLPLALYESRTGDPILISTIRSLPGLTSEVISTIPGRMGLERVQAVFAHPIHYGLFCSVAFALAWVGLEGAVGTARRVLTGGAVALCTFLALSSGALLALALQLFLIGWAFALRKVAWRWWLLIGLGVMAYVAVDLASNRSPVQVFMSYATFSAHNAYYRAIIFEWGMKNVFGDAAAGVPPAVAFGIGLGEWVRPAYMGTGSVDNFWLLVAMRHGVPALGLLAAGWLWTMGRMAFRRLEADPELARLRRAWMFAFVGLTFTLCTVHVWTAIYSFTFFLFGAGMWMLTAAPRPPEAEETAAAPEAEAEPASPYTRFPPRARADAPAPRGRGAAAR